ncbi:hypothetical protein L6452_01653 [Arctium lappa]|uniref:Uncharacterized protein n=1 Tax=Arctium lappa TaxID=4217 RepID=A0ACB9FIR4_ARCLA|nr:hypothetical protein L6452_01653 [Arctium lappa]
MSSDLQSRKPHSPHLSSAHQGVGFPYSDGNEVGMANSKYEYVKSFENEDEMMYLNSIVVRIDVHNFERNRPRGIKRDPCTPDFSPTNSRFSTFSEDMEGVEQKRTGEGKLSFGPPPRDRHATAMTTTSEILK